MKNLRRPPALALLVLAALLAIPASASATLTFVRNPISPVVFVAADDGSKPRKVGAGSYPHVSPDGASVAFLREGPAHAQELQLAAAAGGKPRTLLKGFRRTPRPRLLARLDPDRGPARP